jgi:UDP-N-acetylglucosamine acyltransferase
MSTQIHPQAIIENGAQLGNGVVVEAFAIVGKNSTIGDDSIVRHHATVEGNVTLGKSNEVFPYALIGGLTHDLKYSGGEPGLKIGDSNVFREYSTAHVATREDDFTVIGSNNTFLAYSHVAHDCIVGNHLVMSSHSALGGLVVVEDFVNVGWGVGVHQFCRLGSQCMVSACSKLVQDVPPYMLADGSPAEVRSINKIGLERNGFSKEEIEIAKSVFRILYRGEYNRKQAIEHLENGFDYNGEKITKEILDFTKKSDRGLA